MNKTRKWILTIFLLEIIIIMFSASWSAVSDKTFLYYFVGYNIGAVILSIVYKLIELIMKINE